jgi:nucleoside-diphosphate-sugar epimerase
VSLHIITGDVTNCASLLEAMQGCDQLVHLAAVVDLLTPKTEQQRQHMVETAVQGTRKVLGE